MENFKEVVRNLFYIKPPTQTFEQWWEEEYTGRLKASLSEEDIKYIAMEAWFKAQSVN